MGIVRCNANRILGVVIFCLYVGFIHGQAPGLVIQAGSSMAWVKDQQVTPEGYSHPGWTISTDARLLEGSMYFLVGGQYHQLQFYPISGYALKKGDWHLMMGRFGLGFDLAHISNLIAIRSKLLASINFNITTPEGGIQTPTYETVNEAFFGATSGIGITIGFIDVDLEYQYGIINAFYEKSDTKVNFLSLIAGFHF